MKNVYVIYYNVINFGDDLFLHVLSQRYKNLLQIDRRSSAPFREYSNITTQAGRFTDLIRRSSRKLGITKAMLPRDVKKTSDLVLWVGGSILLESNGIKYWRQWHKDLRAMGLPYYILGCNYQPGTSPEFRQLVGQIIDESQDTCFRDGASYAEFQDHATTRLASDLALALDTSRWEGVEKEKTTLISVINLDATHPEALRRRYESAIVRVAANYAERGYRPILVSFCKSEGDEVAVDRISAAAHRELGFAPDTHLYRGDIDATLHLFATAEAVVATRFHAMILGLLFGCATVPVAYSTKTPDFLNSVRFDGPRFDLDTIEDFAANPDVIDRAAPFDVSEHVRLAHEQFRVLDSVLEVRP